MTTNVDFREEEMKGDTYVPSNEFLLVDNLDEYEDTEDESDDNELANFMTLMDKAHKKNEKRKLRKNNHFGETKNV